MQLPPLSIGATSPGHSHRGTHCCAHSGAGSAHVRVQLELHSFHTWLDGQDGGGEGGVDGGGDGDGDDSAFQYAFLWEYAAFCGQLKLERGSSYSE